MTEKGAGEIAGNSGLFASRLEMAQEEAAGGVCSLRVLRLMHDIDYLVNADTRTKVAPNYNNFGLYGETVSMTVLGQAESEGRLVLAADTSVVEDHVKTQNIFLVDKRTRTALPLWKLIEEPDESPNCSRSIFWPALGDNDLDWSHVVTSADERSAMTLEESLKNEPITNGAVLDLTINIINGSNKSLSKLLELIQAPDVWQRHVQDVNPFMDNQYASAGFMPDFLYQEIASRMAWLSLGGGTYTAKTKPTSGPGKLLFTLDPSSSSSAEVSAQFSDLGSNGPRNRQLGNLVVHDAMTAEPSFINEQGQEIEVGEAAEVSSLAAKAFEVPELVRDPELIDQINSLVQQAARKEISTEDLNISIFQELNDYQRERLIPGLDMGEIDIRDLGPFKFLSGLFPAGLYRATVYANKNQSVFVAPGSSAKLYDSRVYGADLAFTGSPSSGGDSAEVNRCLAVDCRKAFVDVSKAEGCVATDTEQAFTENGMFIGNLAENCNVAFVSDSSKTEYRDNTAKGGNAAFVSYYSKTPMIGNTAIGRYGRKRVLRAGRYNMRNLRGNKLIKQ